MKTNQDTQYIGIDICKARLDVHCRKWSKIATVTNDAKGIRSLFKKLDGIDNVHLVCEATGGYEKKLLNAALKAQIPISLINPRRVRDFAKASGTFAKTDAIDAAIIATFAESIKPAPLKRQSIEQESLRETVRRRDRLVRIRAAEKAILGKCRDQAVSQDVRLGISQLDKRIENLEKLITAMIKQNPQLQQKSDRMRQVKGVGPVIAFTVLAEMPELGSISDNQAASLAGLAPFNSDSGSKKGKRHIQGGRQLLRRTLYTPMLCATQHNAIFRDFYQRLRKAGKPHHLATVAVMRKLIRLLNKILADPHFVPQKN